MKRFVVAAALFVLTASAAPAAPAGKKWFMTVNIYYHNNGGYTFWDKPHVAYLNRAFDTHGDCLARWRTFRKACSSLVATYNAGTGAYGLTKFTGVCRRLRRQPEPALAITLDEVKDYTSSYERKNIEEDAKCMQ